MRTKKQIQAQRRSEIIMSLLGMRTNLLRFRDHYCNFYYHRGTLNVVINSIEKALKEFKELPKEEENWHNMFSSKQL